MGFFDQLPSAPPPEPDAPSPPPPAWMKPEAVIPGVVADEFLLARTDDAAVAVTALTGYPTGFGFTLSVALRHEDRGGRAFDRGFLHGLPPGEPLPPGFLRLGVQFADGSVATNLSGRPFPTDAEPTGPILLRGGGGGGGRRYDMSFWVWPLPPPGPVAFVCEWPAHGIPESRAQLDAQRILDAARRSVQLWPEGG
jgi:hypothetical protein